MEASETNPTSPLFLKANIQIPQRKNMENRIAIAKAMFLANDEELLIRNAHERAMTHKLAEALQNVFRGWHVDCEYNRDGKAKIDLAERKDKTVFPDIIIHRRGIPVNLLVIEATPSDAAADDREFDRRKLDAYVTGGLGYQYALFLTFHVGKEPDVTYEWISAPQPQSQAIAKRT